MLTVVMVIVAVACILIGMGIGKYKKGDTPRRTSTENNQPDAATVRGGDTAARRWDLM